MPQVLPCDHTTPYRSYSGWCNNLRFPAYANAFQGVRRLLEPAYQDGFDQPRSLTVDGKPLPSARTVSNAVHNFPAIQHAQFTNMVMQFGQVIDHDFTLTPQARGKKRAFETCIDYNNFLVQHPTVKYGTARHAIRQKHCRANVIRSRLNRTIHTFHR